MERRYGGPFRRYVSSVDRFLVPNDALGPDSYNIEISTRSGGIRRRDGTVIHADTFGSEVGLLESKFGARPRQIVALHSPVLSDGYPTDASLWTDETDREGQLCWRDTNGTPANRVLGGDYGSGTHYTPNGTGTGVFHVLPLRSFNASTKLTRLNSAAKRRVIGAGARRGMVEGGGWLYVQGDTPLKWNKRWNAGTSGGTNVNRVRPWGHLPPLIMPTIPSADYPSASTSVGPWKAGDTFYVSAMFKFRDGSYSMPMVPREKNATLANGFGLITVPGNPATPDYYTFIPWRGIPIGPEDCEEVVLCRTDKVLDTATGRPPLTRLKICGVVKNGVTSYNDPLGSDEGLVDRPDLVRFDHMLPWRAQCVATNEARALIGGKMRPNPAGIILAPTGVSASGDLNLPEDTTSLGASARFFARVDTLEPPPPPSTLKIKLKYWNGSTVAQTAYDLDALSATTGLTTLQHLVDLINATTTSSSGKEWRAQVAPGTNPKTPINRLLNTDGQDVGDDGIMGDGTTGNIRAFNANLPAVLYLDDTWDAGFQDDEQTIFFTGADPGHPQAALDSFYSTNRRRPPTRSDGLFVGAAPLLNKFVVLYEKAVYVLQNIKGGTSGLDEDYRLVPLNASRGCCAWDSIIWGDGWVGYLTPEGFVMTDGLREVIVSGDVYDSDASSGDWAAEVAASLASTSHGGDDARFHAMNADGAVWVNYRRSGQSFASDTMKYDYSANHMASGLHEVLGPDGLPLGWSSPTPRSATRRLSVMGKVNKSDGLNLLAANEDNRGSLGDGEIHRFNFGDTDNGTAIDAQAWSPADQCGTMRLKTARKVWLMYRKNGSGVTMKFYRDKNRDTAHSITIPSTGSDAYGRLPIELPIGARGNADLFELSLQDSGASTERLEAWVATLDYSETTSET